MARKKKKKSNDDRHGFVGWKEFHYTRREILDAIRQSKGRNVSRPVQTEHGVTGEAKFRGWLMDFLPQKYGVTSGYIIPDSIATDYDLYHYDTIIYDKLNAPVLWTDGSPDLKDQGRKHAIPAKYVRAVFEVKASLTAKSASEAINKLLDLNEFVDHVPPAFTCGVVFFELAPSLVRNRNILPKLIPERRIAGYWGGVVLYCELDQDMTGLFEIIEKPKGAETLDIPIARNIDELPLWIDEAGAHAIESGTGYTAFDGPDKQWHLSKQYGPCVYGEASGVRITWSHNGFANFALGLISRLDGYSPQIDRRNHFGQIYDLILPATARP